MNLFLTEHIERNKLRTCWFRLIEMQVPISFQVHFLVSPPSLFSGLKFFNLLISKPIIFWLFLRLFQFFWCIRDIFPFNSVRNKLVKRSQLHLKTVNSEAIPSQMGGNSVGKDNSWNSKTQNTKIQSTKYGNYSKICM